ncbi:MAG TPA: efflux RND transporter permease subunit [Phycisphaerae bacterium]|nr:efflux RND transporter permease subunit [Phycisphaerae bacterium]
MILSDLAVKNRTTVWVFSLLVVVFGLYSYFTLPREASPDVPIPIILVSTIYEGVAPQDIESAVTIKLERQLAGLKGVKEISSHSAEGISIIVIEFLPNVKIDDAMQYVRDKIDLAKKDLPQEAEETTLTEINVAEFPILMVNISGDDSPWRQRLLADRLEDEIEAIPGVLNCDVLGALEREIRLEIDQDKVAAYGLTIPEILKLIPSENVNISAGGLDTPGTKFNVRVPAEFVEPEEVDELIIAERDGHPIYLTDVAAVHDTFKDRVAFSRMNGKESITVSVQKRLGENIIHITDAVKQVLAEFQRRAPAGMRFEITLDQSKDIRSMVADLENNLISGMILVVAVMVIFMGWRPSLIVALEIPMSMLLTYTTLQLLGYTLNMIVLFSLIMAVGMVVDNAIVMVENIYRHYQLSGRRIQAAMTGAGEVAWPVITSTLTTVAAFAPLIFWPGIMGGFMKYLPITLIIALLASLLIALVVNPMLSSIFVTREKTHGPSRFMHGYRRLLATALEHRFTTLCLAVLLLVGLVILYGKQGHGVELFPEFDPRRAIIDIRCPQGTNIRETDRLARTIEQRLEPFAADLERVITNVGHSGGGEGNLGGSAAGEHLASIVLTFHDYEIRRRPSTEVIAEIRQAIADLPGAEIKVQKQEEGPPTGAAVTVRLVGEDFKVLENLSEQARNLIANVPGLVNLRSDHEAARPELAFRVDRRRAMLLGVNTATVGNFLKTAVFGSEVGKYRQYNDEYDITVRLPLSQRQSIDDLFRLRVPNANGEAVPLSSLGDFEYTGGYGTISRINQKRVITLMGDAEGRLDTAVLADVQERLKQLDLPLGYEVRYAGQKEEQDEAQAFLTKAFFIALFLILMILVTQFNTLIVPLIIMTTVILSLIGVFAGLLICKMPFGIIMTGIGVISLAGVVVNNAIVLLDYTRQLQRRGMDLMAASIEAGATRLRPVLLTACTTILGLIPMALGMSYDFHKFEWAWKSESSQWWASMAIAVIFGLAFATILTLVVVPCLYVTLTRLTTRLGLGQAAEEAEIPDDACEVIR